MSYRLVLGEMELATYDLASATRRGRRQTRGGHAVAREGVGLVKFVANIDDMFTSWIDVEHRPPAAPDRRRIRSQRQRQGTHRSAHAERTGNIVPIDFHLNDDPPTPEPQTVSLPDVWDYNAFLVALRGWEAPPGSTVTAEVLRSRYLWNVKMTIRGRKSSSPSSANSPRCASTATRTS